MRLDVGLPTEIVTAGSDSNVSVCIRLGVEAIQRNCYTEIFVIIGTSQLILYVGGVAEYFLWHL